MFSALSYEAMMIGNGFSAISIEISPR